MELTKKKTQVMKVLLFDGDPAKDRVPKSMSGKRVHDILRKTLDDAIPLRQRGAAFKLEGKRHLLQTMEAMHNPVIFFNKGRINIHIFANDKNQIRKVFVTVKKIN